MPKFTYHLEVEMPAGAWTPTPGGLVGLEYGRGYVQCHRESSGPRVGMRLVRSDGRVMDTAPASTEVSCYAPAGVGYLWPFLARACARGLRRAASDARARDRLESLALDLAANRIERIVQSQEEA